MDIPASSRFHHNPVGVGRHRDQKRKDEEEGKLKTHGEFTLRPCVDNEMAISVIDDFFFLKYRICSDFNLLSNANPNSNSMLLGFRLDIVLSANPPHTTTNF